MFRSQISPTLAAKLFFGALDEMATNWILSRRKYSLAAEADAIVDLFVGGLGQRAVGRPSSLGARQAVSTRIRTVSVLGAGTMGAQIAAHFANAGVPVLLLDVTRDAAREGLARARKLKPDPFFTPDGPALVRTGGFDDDLPAIASADWIIEAVVERLDVKQALFERVDHHRAPHAIVSSNTSGIPIAAIVEGRSPSFRAHALGTHFFNPPRYLRLVEIIRTAGYRPGGRKDGGRVRDHRLGKGVVAAKDTPNFIANRIGLYGVMQILRAWTGAPDGSPGAPNAGFSIEEIDAITGPAIGRPKSATFRTMDLAGIDVLAHVVSNLADSLSRDDDRAVFTLPPIVNDLIERGWVGTKSGQGFYKKDASGEILTLEPVVDDLRACGAGATAVARRGAKAIEDPGARIKALFSGKDKVGRSCATTLGAHARSTPHGSHRRSPIPSTTWTARCSGALAGSWGRSKPGMRSASSRCSRRATSATRRRSSATRWSVEASAEARRRPATSAWRPPEPGLQLLRTAKERTAVVRRNAGASLIDLGDERARRRVPLEDERDRRRHDPDAPGGRQGSRRAIPRARRRQRRAELLGRREPDAAPARSAGGQLGRDRPDGPRLSGRDDGAQARGCPGGRRACRADAWRRMRGRAPCRPRAGGGGNLHGAGRGRRRPHPGWRRHQGDAGARDGSRAGPSTAQAGGSAADRPARVRDDRVRQGVDERA